MIEKQKTKDISKNKSGEPRWNEAVSWLLRAGWIGTGLRVCLSGRPRPRLRPSDGAPYQLSLLCLRFICFAISFAFILFLGISVSVLFILSIFLLFLEISIPFSSVCFPYVSCYFYVISARAATIFPCQRFFTCIAITFINFFTLFLWTLFSPLVYYFSLHNTGKRIKHTTEGKAWKDQELS